MPEACTIRLNDLGSDPHVLVLVVLCHAGDLDLICNWLGNRRWVDALDWAGSDAWSQAKDLEWGVQGKAAGKVKTTGPLTFVQVYKAGHMVSFRLLRDCSG